MSVWSDYVYLDEGVSRYISPLLATGLYGETEKEVVATLVRDAIIRAVAGGIVNVLFAEVEEAPGEVEMPPTKPPCAKCDDQWGGPGVCPACGSDGIPF